MKKIKTYNNFINESLKDKLKGKSKNEINIKINKIIDNLVNKLIKDGYVKSKDVAYNFWFGKYDTIYKLATKYGFNTDEIYDDFLHIINYNFEHNLYKNEPKELNPWDIIPIDESLKDKLKGKSENEILNNVKDLTPEKKIEKGAEYGILSLVKQGIKEGADPSDSDNYAIVLASKKEHLDVVKYLLKDDRVRNKLNEEELEKYKNQVSGLNESLKDKLKGKSEKEILDNVKNLNPNQKLDKGIKHGILPLVKQGIEEGVDPSSLDNYTIRYASQEGHLDVVKELLKDDRVDPSALNNRSIGLSSQEGHLDVVKELLKDKRVDPSDDNNFAIRAASEFGHLNIVKELLKDDRVRNKLSKKDLNYYKKQINNLNESLKDKLKGKSNDEIFNLIINKNLSEITDSLYNIYKKNAPTELIHKIADKYNIPKFNKITIIDILDAMSFIKKYKEGPYDDINIEYRSSYIKSYKLNSIDNKHTYVIRIHIGSGYDLSWTDIRVLPEEEKEVLEYLNDMIKKYN